MSPIPVPPTSIPVVLAPYDPAWSHQAAEIASGLAVLGPILMGVEHVGSTAIPGIAAKPILDLMPLVTTLADLDRQRGLVEALGYEWWGEFGIPDRRYCTLANQNGDRLAQLHCFEAGSPQVTRHLAFRDYLRSHPQVARAYEAEKRRAQRLHPGNSQAYSGEKSAWTEATLADAIAWYRCRSRA